MSGNRKDKKKKKRNLISRKKVLEQREKLRKIKKEQMMKLPVEKLKPFVKANHPTNLVLPIDNTDEQIYSRLENHMETINQIEVEFIKEDSARDRLNKILEEKGLKTLEEKMNFLENEGAVLKEGEEPKKAKGKIKGCAIVEFYPNLD